MMAPGHQVVGLTFGVGTLAFLPQINISAERPFQTVFFLVFVLFGSLLPDIDTPRSKLGQKFWRGLITLFTLALFVYLFAPEFIDQYRQELKVFVMLLLPILLMIRGHRKITHSLSFLAIIAAYSYIIEKTLGIPWLYFTGMIIGVLSHLFGDYITSKGIPFAYPFSKKHVQFLFTFRTGSGTERVIVYSLVLWNVWFLTTQVF